MIVAVLAAIVAGGSVPPSVPPSPTRWLTTTQIEKLLVGKQLSQPDRARPYMRTPEEFRASGGYVRHDDNFEARGSYRIANGQVCVKAERDPERCRRMLIDGRGNYWIEVPANPRILERVSIQHLR